MYRIQPFPHKAYGFEWKRCGHLDENWNFYKNACQGDKHNFQCNNDNNNASRHLLTPSMHEGSLRAGDH